MPRYEEIRAHPELYPKIVNPMSEEEIQARIAWAKEAAEHSNVCGSVIQQITCKLPKHHEGRCEP